MLVLETKTITHGLIVFIICEDRVYLQTPLQTFLLEPTEYYYRKKLQRIALMIEMGHIRKFSDICEQLYDNQGHYINAIRFIPIKREWIR